MNYSVFIDADNLSNNTGFGTCNNPFEVSSLASGIYVICCTRTEDVVHYPLSFSDVRDTFT